MDRQKQTRSGWGAELTSLQFAQLAQRLTAVARAHSLITPAFRSPPRQPGLRRSLQRRPNGASTVAVALRGRSAMVVAADMIDGVTHLNQGGSPVQELAAVRDELWAAVAESLEEREDDDNDRKSKRWVA